MTLLFPPLAWLAHFVFLYVLVSLACPAGAPGLVVPVSALATAAALGFYAWFGWTNHAARRRGEEALAFIGGTNVLVCGLAAVATLWVAYPAFVLPTCAGA